MRRALLLILAATLVAAAVGWIVGVAHREPSPTRTPPSSLLSAWTLVMFAVPPIALAAFVLAPRDPAQAFFGAFFATFGAGVALGLFTPLAAFPPGDFAALLPVDWLATVGRALAGSSGLGMLAGASAYAAAHWRARGAAMPTPVAAPEPAAPPAPEPRAVLPAREPDPEALALAKRRLAMGEITKNDFDELVRRLRE